MKRNKFITKSGVLILTGIVSIAFFLTSCLKDNGPGSIDFSKSPALVGFQYDAGSNANYVEAIQNKSTVTTNVKVALSVASITLKSAVTVNVVEDAAGEQAYAAADTDDNGDPNVHHVIPTSLYSIANSGKVTINPGQQLVTLPITLAGDKIDFSNNYYLGLKLTDANGATIASNLSNVILIITLKSVYDGSYTVTGHFVEKLAAGITDDGVYPTDVKLITQTAYSVAQYNLSNNLGYYHDINSGGSNAAYYGNFDPIFVFDPATAGKITAVNNYYTGNSQARETVLNPSGTNTSTGTPGTPGFAFTVSYSLTQGGATKAEFVETYTYVGP